MLTFTDAAREVVLSILAEGSMETPALRVAVCGSPLAPDYELSLIEGWEESADDLVLDAGGFRVFVDPKSAEQLDGATVDYVQRGGESGFEIRPAGAPATLPEPPAGELAERIRHVIETRINPAIAAHGGHIALAALEGDVAYIQMSGGCQGCGMARVTLRQGVDRMIREAVPEIADIRDITDHAAGVNPYFQPSK